MAATTQRAMTDQVGRWPRRRDWPRPCTTASRGGSGSCPTGSPSTRTRAAGCRCSMPAAGCGSSPAVRRSSTPPSPWPRPTRGRWSRCYRRGMTTPWWRPCGSGTGSRRAGPRPGGRVVGAALGPRYRARGRHPGRLPGHRPVSGGLAGAGADRAVGGAGGGGGRGARRRDPGRGQHRREQPPRLARGRDGPGAAAAAGGGRRPGGDVRRPGHPARRHPGQLADALGAPGHLQVVLRLGHPLVDVPVTPRRPLEDVLS